MKISCEIIRDLLPLYLDGVCSDGSRAAVEEHIAGCGRCKAELEAMRTALPVNNTARNLNAAEAVKNLSERWRRGMGRSLLKGSLCTLLVMALFALIAYVFVDFRIVF